MCECLFVCGPMSSVVFEDITDILLVIWRINGIVSLMEIFNLGWESLGTPKLKGLCSAMECLFLLYHHNDKCVIVMIAASLE